MGRNRRVMLVIVTREGPAEAKRSPQNEKRSQQNKSNSHVGSFPGMRCIPAVIQIDAYTCNRDARNLRFHGGFCDPDDRYLHPLPACVSELPPQPFFGCFPMRIGLRHPQRAFPCQTKQSLALVFPWHDLHPTFFLQQPQSPGKRRAVHRKAGAQLFLIGLPNNCERSEQSELGNLQTCVSQFLVIDSGHDACRSSQILASAGQVEQCWGRLLLGGFRLHIRCIGTFYRRLSRRKRPPRRTRMLVCFCLPPALNSGFQVEIRETQGSLA